MSVEADAQLELDRLVEAFVALVRRGEAPDIEVYAAAHPAQAAELREILPIVLTMEGVVPGEPRTGLRVGPYRIVREIGRGGMGTVYEAVHVDLDRRVALKVLPPDVARDPTFIDRFRLEAQAAARLEHPHIVPVLGYGSHDGLHYFSMQYIDGVGLDRLARLDGPPSPDAVDARRVAAWGLQAAEALAHAHAHGVLHRDVKPANLLLDARDHLWVADFGLCRREGSGGLTRPGAVLGTFRYLPPERFAGLSDARGDVYGVGITLYELLLRRRAYEGDDPAQLARRIGEGAPPRPRALDARIPVDLDTIVRKAMAHDPAQRYPTADALAADLRAFLAGEPIAARAPTLRYVMRRAVARHRALAATILLAAALLVTSTVAYVVHLRRGEQHARLRQYVAGVAAADAALRARDVQGAARALAEAPAEFRDWEWRHLHSRLDRDLRRFASKPMRIRAVAYAADGDVFASTLGDQVWIHDDATGQVRHTLQAEATVQALAWSPRGDRLALGTFEALEVWSWPAAERLSVSDAGEVRELAFVADGSAIVAALDGGRVGRFDPDGTLQATVEVGSRVLALATEPAGGDDRVALGLASGRILVLRAADGDILWSRQVAQRGVHAVVFGQGRVACAVEGTVRAFQADGGEERWTRSVGSESGRLVPDPADRRILVWSGGDLHVLAADRGTPLQVLAGGSAPDQGAVHPRARRLVVASSRGTLGEWYLGDADDARLAGRHMSDATSMDISSTGAWVASGGFGGIVRLWDLETLELARAWWGHEHHIACVRFAPDGTCIASGDQRGEVIVREVPSGRVRARWRAHDAPLHALAWLPDSVRLVTAADDGRLRSWDARHGTPLAERPAADVPARRLATSPDGRWVAAGGADGRIEVLSAADLRTQRRLVGHLQQVSGLAFHPTGALLASVSNDQTLRLWDPESGRLEHVGARHDPELSWDAGLNGVCFSPDGARVAAGSYAGFVRIWSSEDASLRVTLADRHWISDIAFTPDGTRLVTSLSDGMLSIRDSVAQRQRVPAYERAVAFRARALAALEAGEAGSTDLLLDEAMQRVLHQREASHEGLLALVQRLLLPQDGPGDDASARWRVARVVASGLVRGTRHREEPDPRCDALYELALSRGASIEPTATATTR
jgi:WD40 repeat protein